MTFYHSRVTKIVNWCRVWYGHAAREAQSVKCASHTVSEYLSSFSHILSRHTFPSHISRFEVYMIDIHFSSFSFLDWRNDDSYHLFSSHQHPSLNIEQRQREWLEQVSCRTLGAIMVMLDTPPVITKSNSTDVKTMKECRFCYQALFNEN